MTSPTAMDLDQSDTPIAVCPVCTEPYAPTPDRDRVTCPYACSGQACITCYDRYLSDLTLLERSTTHCMHCGKEWDSNFVKSAFPSALALKLEFLQAAKQKKLEQKQTPPPVTEAERKAQKNLEEILSKLRIEDIKNACVQDPFVAIDDDLYYAQDYGAVYKNDFNLCFYLCIEEGDGHDALMLKKILSPYVKNLDDDPVYYGNIGIMANSDVLYSFVIEWGTPLCVFDEATGGCQRIFPVDPEEEEACIYLLRCASDHFKRLYPLNLEVEFEENYG